MVIARNHFMDTIQNRSAFFDSDLALCKTFHITDRQTVEFRVSATNFLDHPLVGYSNNNPLTLKYALGPNNPSAGHSYVGTTPGCCLGCHRHEERTRHRRVRTRDAVRSEI